MQTGISRATRRQQVSDPRSAWTKQPRPTETTGRSGSAPFLAFDFCDVMHQDVAQRDQALQLGAIHNRKMAESELTHDKQALFDGLVGVYCPWIRGHDLRHGRVTRCAA